MTPSVDIIIPTCNRPTKLESVLRHIEQASPFAGVIVVTEDMASAELADGHSAVAIYAEGTAPVKWNFGVAASKADWFVLGTDDSYLQTGWWDVALRANVGGYVGLRDAADKLHYWYEHFMISREFCVIHAGGVLACPLYHHQYIDVEMTHRAIKAGCVASTPMVVCEHRHWTNSGAEMDDIYRRGRETFKQDQAIFQARRAAGFPDDFTPVVT